MHLLNKANDDKTCLTGTLQIILIIVINFEMSDHDCCNAYRFLITLTFIIYLSCFLLPFHWFVLLEIIASPNKNHVISGTKFRV